VAIVVGVSDAQISTDPQEVLVTYSLGSCIGLTAYDPVAKCGGMLHYQLPTSTLDAGKAAANPFMFADSGTAELLKRMQAKGAVKARLKVKIAGAAEILNDNGVFSIGRRNHAAIRKILWQHGLMLEREHVGGTAPRTLYLHIADGSAVIKTNGETLAL
jgi:chemotaxis protein CheD